jgi:hypothetical protein
MNSLVKSSEVERTSNNGIISEKIKQWSSLDMKIKFINEKTKEMREKKQELAQEIVASLNRFSPPPKITIDDDYQLQVYSKKETTALSFTYIEKCLGEILKDQEQIDFIVAYLKEHRETSIVQDIRRTPIKK